MRTSSRVSLPLVPASSASIDVSRMLTRFLDIMFPRRCIMCNGVLSCADEVLCTSCLVHAPVIEEQDYVSGVMCRHFWHLLPIEKAAAMFRYSHYSAWNVLITAGKFGHRGEVMYGMGLVLGRHFLEKGFFEGIDAIVPMPATRGRVWRRGFNQALLLARAVSRVTGLPLLDRAVARCSDNGSQVHRTRWERSVAMQHDFIVKDPAVLTGRHLLLIDDVFTTGASLTALGETVSKVPGVHLSVLTLFATQ